MFSPRTLTTTKVYRGDWRCIEVSAFDICQRVVKLWLMQSRFFEKVTFLRPPLGQGHNESQGLEL